jgi:putative ABC transport system permease protein
MITNHLRLALRNLARQKGYAGLNILGLAVGVAAVLMIYRIIAYELSFNKNFSNYDRITRIVTDMYLRDGTTEYNRGIPLPAMQQAKQSVPQFAATAQIREAWPFIIVPDAKGGPSERKFVTEEGSIGFFAEPELFQVFDFQWLAGDPATALQGPKKLVLTRKTAEQCFDQWPNAVGKVLFIDNEPMTVAGVIDNPPINCEFQVNLLISYETLSTNKEKYDYFADWGSISSGDQMYGLLSNTDQLAAATAQVNKIGQYEYSDNGKAAKPDKMHQLQAFADLHYNDDYGTSSTPIISKDRLWVLGTIGCLVLLMACFNFINLSTAQAIRRSNEVGVRKTLGGSRGALMGQFMAETAVVSLLSTVLGVLLAWLAMPFLTQISNVPVGHPFWEQPAVWAFLAAVFVVVTLFSGFYPALVLAGFNPIQALKNNVSARTVGGASVRKGLVVSQFAIAQILIVGTLVTLGQLEYIRTLDLGFKKDLVYMFFIEGDSVAQSKMAGFKQRLQQVPGIESVTMASDVPASGSTNQTNVSLGVGKPDLDFSTTVKYCDAGYANTFGLQMVAGRWLEPTDTIKEFVINETMVRKAGIASAEAAIGQQIRLGSGRYRSIVGVVKDFHAHSLHREVLPLVMGSRLKRFQEVGVKIAPQNMEATTAAIRREFDQTYPEKVFYGRYFDETIADFYDNEQRFSATCKGFGLLAVFISCLGLLGLAAYAAQKRTKEIGVRKVLGASVGSITGLLAKDFLALVLVAVLVASPIAYYMMDSWLSEFAYRIPLYWWIFAAAGIGAVAIAFLTVSVQSIRAATANPVKSLRSE